MSIGGSELFTVPRLDPGVRDVSVYLGWAGRLTRATHVAGTAFSTTARIPGFGPLVRAGLSRVAGSATGQGPGPEERSGSTTVAVARTRDGVGRELSTARVEGPSPYDLTADLLAWGAAMLLTGQAEATGALGPADAFGLTRLRAGLRRPRAAPCRLTSSSWCRSARTSGVTSSSGTANGSSRGWRLDAIAEAAGSPTPSTTSSSTTTRTRWAGSRRGTPVTGSSPAR